MGQVSTTTDQQSLLRPDTLAAVQVDAPAASLRIALDTAQTYQEMDGFGFSLTGGSALNLQRMSAAARAAILQELFGHGPGDIRVSYLRLSIGASDLDEYPWSYDDLPDGETDPELAHFSLGYDTLYLIPTLKEILAIQPAAGILSGLCTILREIHPGDGRPWHPPRRHHGTERAHEPAQQPEHVYAGRSPDRFRLKPPRAGLPESWNCYEDRCVRRMERRPGRLSHFHFGRPRGGGLYERLGLPPLRGGRLAP